MGRKTDALREARRTIEHLSELLGEDGGCEFCESIHETSDVTGYGLEKYCIRSKPLPTLDTKVRAVIVYDNADGFVLAISTDFDMLPLDVHTTTGTRLLAITTNLPITNCPMCGSKLRCRI